MQFKDIKPGYPVYILNKQDMTLCHSKAKQVSLPYPEPAKQNIGGVMPTAKRVLDITIEDNGRIASYTIPEDLSIAYTGDLVLATDTAGIMCELRSYRSEQEQVIASMDQRKENLAKAVALMAELDPSIKEKQATDRRLDSLEASIKEMHEMMRAFVQKTPDTTKL